MEINEKQQALLRALPGIDRMFELAKAEDFAEKIPRSVLVRSARSVVEDLRRGILESRQEITESSLSEQRILETIKIQVEKSMALNLMRAINATGIVVHTNLGRSLLSTDAVDNLLHIGSRYSNLEYDLSTGKRGSRYECVEDLLCEISAAEAAMVVNNNAGAVLLCLDTMAKGKSVIVSRGELVEIGGSFRVPDVMARSGGILKEVGTTNRTHLMDYENAIDDRTGLLLKVHTSNYAIVGFTSEVSLKELVALGNKYSLPVMEDLGSGTFIDFSKYGMIKEPTVQEAVASGTDVVTFSGDKLLGGPQAGIILGKKDILDKIKRNPLTRALRIDKLTLAALESTLRLYRNEEDAIHAIPTLRMLTLPFESIALKAKQLGRMLESIGNPDLNVKLLSRASKAGGGSLPFLDLPTECIGVRVNGMSVNALERYMRGNIPPIIGRIEEDLFLMDLRTIQDDELSIIVNAFKDLLKKA